jgi:glutamyl-tRNA synthetase
MKPAGRLGAATHWICNSCRLRRQARPSVPLAPSSSYSSSSKPPRGRLPDTPARTRFAPSPTGNLHLGSIRTAAFNYLLAKRTNGQFLLRLEDTDQKRTVEGAEERLYDDLKWAGLHWDEGPNAGGPYGPYRQSERLQFYHNHVQSLLQKGHAYRCFCSPERLDELNRRRHEKGLNLGYDRKCAHLDHAQSEDRAHKGEPHVIRFRSPQDWPRYTDLVYGKTGHGAEKTKKLLVDEPVWGDAILVKTDGFPTYHWANVCDDFDMKITHVVRGSEWMSSTPLHVALYQAMDWAPPFYAHVPLLVDVNGQKLSKRNFDTNIVGYRDSGMSPDALVNFAALLGWSHQRKDDVMDLKELEQAFDMKITKGNTIVSFNKLQFLQDQHAKRRVRAQGEPFEQMIRDVASALLDQYGAARMLAFIGNRQLRDVVASMLQVDSFRYSTPQDFAAQCTLFVEQSLRRPAFSGDLETASQLRIAAATLTLVPEDQWNEHMHKANLVLLGLAEGEGNKIWKKELYSYLRWALLGGVAGPTIPKVMEILGRKTCVDRIQSAALELKNAERMATRPAFVSENRGLTGSSFSNVKDRAAAHG